LIKESVNYPD